MTDHAPLTDEELDRLRLRYAHLDHVGRLIADLRAARERIKELEAALEGKMSREEWYQDYAQW